jgi:hypothetical protein
MAIITIGLLASTAQAGAIQFDEVSSTSVQPGA